MSDVRNGNSCSTLTFSASNDPKVSNNTIFAVGEKITPQSPNGDRSGNQTLKIFPPTSKIQMESFILWQRNVSTNFLWGVD